MDISIGRREERKFEEPTDTDEIMSLKKKSLSYKQMLKEMEEENEEINQPAEVIRPERD
jgi:hypothetical protein